jgi:hypothetical protein
MFAARFRVLLLAALSACVSVSCGDSAPDPANPANPANPGTAKTSARKSSVVENMVAAVSAGKSATAVGVHFSLGDAPSVGKALSMDIVVLPHVEFSSLRARIESQSGLTLISGDNIAPMSGVDAEKAIRHKVVLMPESEGVYMITVSLETEGSEGTVSRIFSIPVIVTPSSGTPATSAPPTPPAAG